MLRNCGSFLRRQIELVDPIVIVAMGGIAIKTMDQMRNAATRSVSEAVGTAEVWDGRLVVPIAHTSGGSRFLNNSDNKAKQIRAKAFIREAIVRIRVANRI
jgi:uracil-DNA glycosylase